MSATKADKIKSNYSRLVLTVIEACYDKLDLSEASMSLGHFMNAAKFRIPDALAWRARTNAEVERNTPLTQMATNILSKQKYLPSPKEHQLVMAGLRKMVSEISGPQKKTGIAQASLKELHQDFWNPPEPTPRERDRRKPSKARAALHASVVLGAKSAVDLAIAVSQCITENGKARNEVATEAGLKYHHLLNILKGKNVPDRELLSDILDAADATEIQRDHVAALHKIAWENARSYHRFIRSNGSSHER